MRARTCTLALTLAVTPVLVACNGGGVSGGDGGVPPDAAEPAGSFTLRFGPISVAPGVEKTQCVTKRLGNPEQLRVGQIHNVLGTTSHHFIVYRTNDAMERATPYDCQPFSDTLDPSKGSPLMITQKHDETLKLPQGVAFTLEANQMMRLEMHYINAGAQASTVEASATFLPIPDVDFRDEANFLFIGNPDIDIAARSMKELGPTFFPPPMNLAGSKFFGITGHTHQYGTQVYVEVAESKTGPGRAVYDVPWWSWDEPETVYADPPFEIPAGGGFRFTCEWNNTSDRRVQFGESANDEMCFFWAYYYPSKGAYVCAHTDRVSGGYDLCCPGNPFCSQLF